MKRKKGGKSNVILEKDAENTMGGGALATKKSQGKQKQKCHLFAE